MTEPIGISFCGFQTGLLLVLWVLVARWVFKAGQPPVQLQET